MDREGKCFKNATIIAISTTQAYTFHRRSGADLTVWVEMFSVRRDAFLCVKGGVLCVLPVIYVDHHLMAAPAGAERDEVRARRIFSRDTPTKL